MLIATTTVRICRYIVYSANPGDFFDVCSGLAAMSITSNAQLNVTTINETSYERNP